MGRHFWTKNIVDEDDHKQPGCISGLINVLDYHHWHSNTRKMIPRNRYAGQTDLNGYWNSKMNLLPLNSCEVEKLLNEKESPFLKTKRARATNKRSLRSRIKALIAEEIYKESTKAETKEGFSLKSRLQRTYSIHHLESLDDSINKICTDWKNPIILIPSKVENYAPTSVDIKQTDSADSNEASAGESSKFSPAKTEFLDMLKVDKELFVRNLQIADDTSSRFSLGGLVLNEKGKLSKSRSFPVLDPSRRLKFKPSKLADKQKETWLFPKGEKLEDVHQLPLIKEESKQKNQVNVTSDVVIGIVDTWEETKMDMVGESTRRNYSHSRSSSVNESLDKYARLFENSYGTEANLKPSKSKSLRLTNENGNASMSFGKIRSRSLSNADYFYANLSFGDCGDENGSFETADGSFGLRFVDEEKVVSLGTSDTEKEALDLFKTIECKTGSIGTYNNMQRMEDDGSLKSSMTGEISETIQGFKEEAPEVKSCDSLCVPESINCSDPRSVLDLNSIAQEKLSRTEQLKTSEEKFVKSLGHNSDSHYVRLILEQSGIAKDACERAWHSLEQPLGPEILEDVEASCPHEHDQSTSLQDFCSSCWHHQMLFDLVNQVLVETYDVSLPYYPKALSSGCQVRPFPVGTNIVEEVSKSISRVLSVRTDEKQLTDCIVARDLGVDYRWMNLQFESECIGLELEDAIFDELVQEIIRS